MHVCEPNFFAKTEGKYGPRSAARIIIREGPGNLVPTVLPTQCKNRPLRQPRRNFFDGIDYTRCLKTRAGRGPCPNMEGITGFAVRHPPFFVHTIAHFVIPRASQQEVCSILKCCAGMYPFLWRILDDCCFRA